MPTYIRTRSEFAVNSYTAENQTAPAVATFADGSFIIVWGTLDETQDGQSSAIKGQRFDAAGQKVGTEFLVNSSFSGSQFTPSVTTLPNGNFVVSWVQSGSEPFPAGDGSDGIKARLFDRYGAPLGAEFQVDDWAPGSEFTPNVTALSNGGFVISWDHWSGFDMKGRIFDADGNPVGGPIQLNTNSSGAQEYGDIVGLAGGGFVATWRTTDTTADGSGQAVKAQVFDSAGAKVGGEFLVNSQKAGDQYSPTVAALTGGGFVITWYTTDTTQDGSLGAVKAQVFTAAGAKVGTEFLVNTQATDTQNEPMVTATPDGGFIIAWTSRHTAQDGSGSAIKAQAFDSAGAKIGTEMLVNTLATGSQFLPDIATLADGRVIVTWTSESGDIGGYAVRAQILGFEAAAPLPNTRPIIISGGGTSAAVTIDEGTFDVMRVVASDDGEPNNLRYSISGGYDASLFRIDARTGMLSFISAPEHVEGQGNFYSVYVAASDGELVGTQLVQVTVRHVNHVMIVSDGGYDWASLTLSENETAVTTVAAVDDDGLPLTYSISGGEDAHFFTIDAQTGALSFTAAPDFEYPQDWYSDNRYYLEVTATDGTRSDSQYLEIVVADVDETGGFSITSDGGGGNATVGFAENSTLVTTVTTQGAGESGVFYEISGGYHASWFTIDPTTGELHILGPLDYEATYYGQEFEVVVRASSGELVDEQRLHLILQDVDEGPVFRSHGGQAHVHVGVYENSAAVDWVGAEDQDRHSSVTYGIAGGADAALFQVDSITGELTFAGASLPDFENPADADGNNIYEVVVAAFSGSQSATQSFSVHVEDVSERVVITSDGGGIDAKLYRPESGVFVTTVAAAGSNEIVYEIVGGRDAAAFKIDPYTGELGFAFAPDFEAPGDYNGDNVYDVIVRAGDGRTYDQQRLSIELQNVDELPYFYDSWGSASVPLSVTENRANVSDIRASDPDGATAFTYSIVGGADAARFAIDAQTGALSFANGAGADFEAPGDANGNNVYEVKITAASAGWSRTQAFSVTVGNQNEGIAITSDGGGTSAALSVAEGQREVTTVVARDADGTAPTYSIVGGPDAARFAIDAATGALSFVAAPDYEAPADAAASNFYTVEVAASDGQNSATQKIQVSVGNVNEGLRIVSYDAVDIVYLSHAENGASAAQLAATDTDGDTVTYSIAGGADAALFTVDAATGALSFLASPDFERPADADGDNVYSVVVTASDGEHSDWQAFGLIVGNAEERIAITSNGGGEAATVAVGENGTAVTTVTAADPDGATPAFSIAGGADAARFTIDAQTGVLQFLSAPDFEARGDADGDNVYAVVVAASDGSTSTAQSLSVRVENRDEGLTLTSYGASATVSLDVIENDDAVGKVAAVDADGDAVAYAITGGEDAALFQVDAATGALRFVGPRDYEGPTDRDSNNVYKVEVTASATSFAVSQAFAVTVKNVNEGLSITSNGAGDMAALTVAENGRAVTTVTALDLDGTAPRFAIVGGADAARFTIDTQTGALQFVAAPDYEAAGDADRDNLYEVLVQATDGQFSDVQALRVAVGNVRDGRNVTGTSGNDTINGTSTNTALRTTGAEDTVYGRDGHDTIQGLAGDDWLFGEGGKDVVTGGAGADRLSGGIGADQFVYDAVSESTAAAMDVITDFSRAEGDRISLSTIDANSLLSSNQAFTFIGTSAFSGVAGQLRYEVSGGNTLIFGDVNGDGVADLQIQLTGQVALVSSDFFL